MGKCKLVHIATGTQTQIACNMELENEKKFGRGEWIRTTDLLVPNQAL